MDFDQWTAQDGSKRSKHRIHVDNCQFLGGGPGEPGQGGPAASGEARPGDDGAQIEEPDNNRKTDDIPF